MAGEHSADPGEGLSVYRRKPGVEVTAIRLDLDTDGFEYRKWGGTQRCKQGDWLVDNQGSTYTVDAETFAKTYHEVRPGRYVKVTAVWAERAAESGTIATKEGSTDFDAGDFLVYNGPDRADGYALSAEEFHRMYELAE